MKRGPLKAAKLTLENALAIIGEETPLMDTVNLSLPSSSCSILTVYHRLGVRVASVVI